MTSIYSPRWCDRELGLSTALNEIFADSGNERRETTKSALPRHPWLARRGPKSGSAPHDRRFQIFQILKFEIDFEIGNATLAFAW
jgi:hypothetical protein